MTTLFTYRHESITLADALGAFATMSPSEAVSLVYAPGWCGFARFAAGRLTDHREAEPPDAYEVRVFHDLAELRWRKDPAGKGEGAAAILCRDERDELPNLGWNDVSRKDVIDENPATYLLWGEATNTRYGSDWGQLGTARVGAVPVPDPKRELRPEARMRFHAVEYIAADEYGSAFVCEERLTGLKPAEQKENGRG